MPALVATGQEKEALTLFRKHFVQKPLPQKPIPNKAIQELRTKTVLQPDNLTATNQLLMAYLSRQMWDDASRTAEKSLKLAEKAHDTYYWLGLALSKTERDKEAARAYAQWLSSEED